jgi:2-polyprenyl-6-methoxyphenol hydroxylase-like FAD-dependent oxidoreductase
VGNKTAHWQTCPDCQGRGKKSRRLRKKVRRAYQNALDKFEKAGENGEIPKRPRGHQDSCVNCSGSGLTPSANPPTPDKENYPHVAIIGAGIGGVALAVACMHRQIPYTLYEWDKSFDDRSQGYGLTLQQASKAIEGLGIFSLNEGVISTRHVVHTTEGKEIGEWGIRKWLDADNEDFTKRTNVHIARQSLRLALIEQLGGENKVQWGHQLVDLKTNSSKKIELTFQENGKTTHANADLVVGADGIRSSVRRLMIGDDISPLRYLDCIVILGICALKDLKEIESPLLDSATVFQTANGHERMYMMPYSADAIMWQFSFPMTEKAAKELSDQGAGALKAEAQQRADWHFPIPQILSATQESKISGYPVYDRELLQQELLEKGGPISLIGDAAHPMSPFKGQGANQALLDSLALARGISMGCRAQSQWRESGIRKSVLTEFETEMLARSASKVEDSAEAAKFLHSDVVLHEGDEPRGRSLKRNNKK